MIGGSVLAAIFLMLTASGLEQVGPDGGCTRSPTTQSALTAIEADEDTSAAWTALIEASVTDGPACEAAVRELAYRAGVIGGQEEASRIALLRLEAGDAYGGLHFLATEIVEDRITLSNRATAQTVIEAACVAQSCLQGFELIHARATGEARSALSQAELEVCAQASAEECAMTLSQVVEEDQADDPAALWYRLAEARLAIGDLDGAFDAATESTKYASSPRAASSMQNYLWAHSNWTPELRRGVRLYEECSLIVDSLRGDQGRRYLMGEQGYGLNEGDLPDRCGRFFNLQTGMRIDSPRPNFD